MNINGTTSQGHKFSVFLVEAQNEIVYFDCFGDSLTWDDNPKNRKLVKAMIETITNE